VNENWKQIPGFPDYEVSDVPGRMSGKPYAIITDLDGTVARRNELRPDPYNMELVHLDDPVWPIINLVNTLVSTHQAKLIVVTAREAIPGCFDATTAWLHKHGLLPDEVFMRAHKDNRRDDIVKEEFYVNHIEPHYDVLYVLDDRRTVVSKWRELGLVCLAVDEGDF
jgi:hypothetical protein